MCTIIDANVAHELTEPYPDSAGTRFLERVESGTLEVVVGGQLRKELNRTSIREWVRQAIVGGKARSVNDEAVDAKTEEVHASGLCLSDDPHIIALALISGARLLYSNDRDLQRDFKNRELVPDTARSGLQYSDVSKIRR